MDTIRLEPMNTTKEYFENWLRKTARPAMSPIVNNRYTSLRTPPVWEGDRLVINGLRHYIRDEEHEEGYPLSGLIEFEVVPLSPDRIRLNIEYISQDQFIQDCVVNILKSLFRDWPEASPIQQSPPLDEQPAQPAVVLESESADPFDGFNLSDRDKKILRSWSEFKTAEEICRELGADGIRLTEKRIYNILCERRRVLGVELVRLGK